MPTELFLDAVKHLVQTERDWVPNGFGRALYLRPVMIANEAAFGVRRAKRYLFFIVATPVDAIYQLGNRPLKLLVSEEFCRSAPGSCGNAKTSGNYAQTIYALERARAEGFDNILWLDGVRRELIEEVGIANVFVRMNEYVVTPRLTDCILPGVTRESIITLIKDQSMEVVERDVSIYELLEGLERGNVTEIFITGTATHVAPIGSLRFRDRDLNLNHQNGQNSLTDKLYRLLASIQLGQVPDYHGWMMKLQ